MSLTKTMNIVFDVRSSKGKKKGKKGEEEEDDDEDDDDDAYANASMTRSVILIVRVNEL